MKKWIWFLPLALAAAAAAREPIRYELSPLPDDREQVDCSFAPDQLELLEKLNRCDRERLYEQDRVVTPSEWLENENHYAPLPERLDWARELPQVILVHQPLQAFAAYESGRLVRWGPVSTGAEKSPTPAGLFNLNWKSKGHRSSVNRAWYLPWYFNFSNETGHSFHQYALPGGPASHGCVRLLERDAVWLYEWGRTWSLDERGWQVREHGTPVFIVGEYAHEETPPWKEPSLVESGFELSREGAWLARKALELADGQWSVLTPPDAAEESGDLE